MSKKTLRIITILSTIVAVLAINVLVFASSPIDFKESTPTDAFDDIGKKIIGGLQAFGNIIAVAILIVLGIKYMMGSAEEKAEYKKTMIPYVIGAVLIFAAANIAQMVYSFANSISTVK